MIFLGTPHKGSDSAQTLNNILRTIPGFSAKNYVAELENNSNSLQDINEQFRNICGDLELVSFYETLKTNLGAGVKKIVSARLSNHAFISVCNPNSIIRLWKRTPQFLDIPAKRQVH